MLRDREGNKILLSESENFHIKAIGRSGCGKTFWACRYIEKLSKSVPVIIFDYSGSYSEEEREKNQFFLVDGMHFKVLDFVKDDVRVKIPVTHAVDTVADSLIVILNVRAIYQKELIHQACERAFSIMGYFSFEGIYKILTALKDSEEELEYMKSAEMLMSRLYHLKNLYNFRIVQGSSARVMGNSILQMSNLPMRIRVDLSQFVLEVLWREFQQNCTSRVQIVLDEFQILRLKGTAVEEMLREGRKFGIGLTLLTQYVSPDIVDSLEQAATSLYFLPNDRNLQQIAYLIDPQNYRCWMPILKNLRRGQCILDGNFEVNGNTPGVKRPLVCSVDKPPAGDTCLS